MPDQMKVAHRFIGWIVIVSIVFSMLLVGVTPTHAADPSQQAVPRFEQAACMFTMPAGFVEGTDVKCGWLTVPEQYDDPQGPTIRLAVAIIISESPNPAPDPLVMAQGGPGGSTIETYIQTIGLIAPRLRANRDIILFDQRGTLYSEPSLVCSEYHELVIETLDQDIPDDEAYQMVLDSMEACRTRLENQDVNLSAFDSIENARDVESLRQAMGYEQINLYGVSYGTLLAQHVMRLFPESLRSVVLDAVVPTDMNFVIGAPQTQYRSFQELFAACQQDENCNSHYPNLEEVFFGVVDELNAEPAFIQVTDPETQQSYRAIIDGDTFMSGIFQMMYVADLVPFMPKVIYDARVKNFDFFSRIYAALVFDQTLSLGMYYTVMCAEDADFSPDDVDLTGLPEQMTREERDNASFFLEACQMWGVDELGPEVDEPVQSEVPTLLFSGNFDPITPPAYANQVDGNFPNSYNIVIPWGAHGAVASSVCADQILLDFLNNPNQEPDTSCIAAHEGIEFITPGTLVRLPILGQLLNLEGNTGIQLLVYTLALLFLLTALLIYPVVWLVRLISGRPQPAASQPAAPGMMGGQPAVETVDYADLRAAAAPRRPGIYRFAPWFSALTALLLLAFTILFVGVAFNLALSFDYRVIMGLPGSSRPIFSLPLIAALLALIMLFGAIVAWTRRSGSAWGRVYFTLLTLAALVCVGILGTWGMLTALFA